MWTILIGLALLVYGSDVAQSIAGEAAVPTLFGTTANNEAAAPLATDVPVNTASDGAVANEARNEMTNSLPQPQPTAQVNGVILFDFNGNEPAWYEVNDDVMGGVSTSVVVVDGERQQLTFSGNLSLANNGGFASARSAWAAYDLGSYDGIHLRVRGDGHEYRLRIYTEGTGSDIAYTAIFPTEANTWQDIYIPFADMVPLYRGFVVNEAGPLDATSIRSFGLMLADKQQGEFSLDVDWLRALAQ